MRCFIAFCLPEDLRSRLRRALHDAKIEPTLLTDPDKYHVTLRFAGTVDDHGLRALDVAAALVATQHAPFTVGLAGAGTFPGVPVVWLGVAGDLPAATGLWRGVQTATTGIGDASPPAWNDPDFAFRPHVTVARTPLLDATQNRALADQLAALGLTDSWDVSSFGLFSTRPDGSYDELATYPLSG